MPSEELLELIDSFVVSRAEYQRIELKAARHGCPERLYDTLSSFSNQDEGGILIFGIDEQNDFEQCDDKQAFIDYIEAVKQCVGDSPVLEYEIEK